MKIVAYYHHIYMKIVAYYYHYYWHDSLLKLDSLNPNSILFLWHNVTGVSGNFRPENNLEDKNA